jgi:hypothetical protein
MATPNTFSISNMFRTAPPTVPGSSGVPNKQINPGADPANSPDPKGGTTTLNPADPNSLSGSVDPLDAFKDMFTITEDDQKKRAPDPFADPLLNFDVKKFGEASGKMDFLKGVSPEVITKALGGDVQAFSAVVNRAVQSSFVASAQVFSGILEQAIKKNNGRWDSSLSDRFNKLQLSSLRPENPALQHPAAQPMLEAIKSTIASKDPTLRPDEVAKKAEEYLGTFAEAFLNKGKSGKSQEDLNNPGEIDWSAFLNLNK